jgi:hypothetical protein
MSFAIKYLSVSSRSHFVLSFPTMKWCITFGRKNLIKVRRKGYINTLLMRSKLELMERLRINKRIL